MTKKLQYMPLFVPNILADIAAYGLKTDEVGAYCLILFHMWNHGGELNLEEHDLRSITRLSQHKFLKIFPRLRKFFTVENEKYLRNSKLTEVWIESVKRHERAVNAARAKHGKDDFSTAKSDFEQCYISNSKKEVKESISTPPTPPPGGQEKTDWKTVDLIAEVLHKQTGIGEKGEHKHRAVHAWFTKYAPSTAIYRALEAVQDGVQEGRAGRGTGIKDVDQYFLSTLRKICNENGIHLPRRVS